MIAGSADNAVYTLDFSNNEISSHQIHTDSITCVCGDASGSGDWSVWTGTAFIECDAPPVSIYQGNWTDLEGFVLRREVGGDMQEGVSDSKLNLADDALLIVTQSSISIYRQFEKVDGWSVPSSSITASSLFADRLMVLTGEAGLIYGLNGQVHARFDSSEKLMY